MTCILFVARWRWQWISQNFLPKIKFSLLFCFSLSFIWKPFWMGLVKVSSMHLPIVLHFVSVCLSLWFLFSFSIALAFPSNKYSDYSMMMMTMETEKRNEEEEKNRNKLTTIGNDQRQRSQQKVKITSKTYWKRL